MLTLKITGRAIIMHITQIGIVANYAIVTLILSGIILCLLGKIL